MPTVTQIITVHVESEPHTTDLSGVPLNRPAPNGGSFLISADDLEDMDMFQSTPGWRYSSAAMEVLIGHGYTLALRDAQITTVEAWRALWTDEAKAAYRQRIEAARAAAEQAERERKAAAEADRAIRGASYAIWQRTFLASLVSTSIGPDYSAGHVYHAEKGTPGAWYDTGDRWYRNPAGVLRRDYGNDRCSQWRRLAAAECRAVRRARPLDRAAICCAGDAGDATAAERGCGR